MAPTKAEESRSSVPLLEEPGMAERQNVNSASGDPAPIPESSETHPAKDKREQPSSTEVKSDAQAVDTVKGPESERQGSSETGAANYDKASQKHGTVAKELEAELGDVQQLPAETGGHQPEMSSQEAGQLGGMEVSDTAQAVEATAREGARSSEFMEQGSEDTRQPVQNEVDQSTRQEALEGPPPNHKGSTEHPESCETKKPAQPPEAEDHSRAGAAIAEIRAEEQPADEKPSETLISEMTGPSKEIKEAQNAAPAPLPKGAAIVEDTAEAAKPSEAENTEGAVAVPSKEAAIHEEAAKVATPDSGDSKEHKISHEGKEDDLEDEISEEGEEDDLEISEEGEEDDLLEDEADDVSADTPGPPAVPSGEAPSDNDGTLKPTKSLRPTPSLKSAAPRTVTVKIKSANHLPKQDLLGKTDPFCVVKYNAVVIKTTQIIKSNYDPVWDEEISLDLRPTDSLLFELWDYDGIGRNDYTGSHEINGQDLLNKSNKEITDFSVKIYGKDQKEVIGHDKSVAQLNLAVVDKPAKQAA